MKNRKVQTYLLAIALCVFFGNLAAWAQEIPNDYQDVLKSLGKQGDYKSNVLKINIPRNDLKVIVDGVATPTPFGFGGWLAMTKGDGGKDVMMGDLVLLQEEVNPVMSALLDNGIDVTALHNHFFWDDPHVYYMHVHGMGKAADLAHRGLARIVRLEARLERHDRDPGRTPLERVDENFHRCPGCERLYWRGSHYDRLVELLERTRARLAQSSDYPIDIGE